MLEMMDAIYEEVVMLVALGAGSALFAYFKKLHSTQKSLCEQVSKLQKTYPTKQREFVNTPRDNNDKNKDRHAARFQSLHTFFSNYNALGTFHS